MSDRPGRAGRPTPQVPDRARPGEVRDLSALDDTDAAVYTIGQAAELLGVPVPALRRLDDVSAMEPTRSAGGQRRYSRRQLERARRILTLVGEGTPIAAAGRIAHLEDQVATLTDQLHNDGDGADQD